VLGRRFSLGRAAALAGVASVVVGASACWDTPTALARSTPVISLTLVEGESYQLAFVSLGTDADSTIPDASVPIPAAQVQLRIEDDSGHVWPLQASVIPGRFVAALSPHRGEYYRLSGSVVGRVVTARTRVPASFSLAAPPGDTLTALDTAPCTRTPAETTACIRVRVELDGAVEVGYIVSGSVGPYPERGLLREVGGEVWFFRSDFVRDVVFLAYNADAAGWLWRSTARGNVAGAFGGFGAAIALRRKVYIP